MTTVGAAVGISASIAAAEKIERCSAQLLLKFPWWASLYLNLIRVETTTETETMAVDGTHLFYNPEFTVGLTDKQCLGVLLHEVGHIALLHIYRRNWRESKRWNVACDKAVNAILEASNIELPEDCVPPGPLGETAEELYEKVTEDEMKMYFPDILDAFSGTNGNGLTEKDWRDILAGSHSLIPDSIARVVGEAAQPRKDWKGVLAQFIYSTIKSDSHTWSRPNRRIRGLPGWNREPAGRIVVVLDTSGSITGPILSAFVAEVSAITRLNGLETIVMSADAKVQQVIEPGEPLPTEWKGGGGTSFIPALKAAEKYEPNCIVYLTDGEGTYPPGSQYPVLWALTQCRKVPFGEQILVEFAIEKAAPKDSLTVSNIFLVARRCN